MPTRDKSTSPHRNRKPPLKLCQSLFPLLLPMQACWMQSGTGSSGILFWITSLVRPWRTVPCKIKHKTKTSDLPFSPASFSVKLSGGSKIEFNVYDLFRAGTSCCPGFSRQQFGLSRMIFLLMNQTMKRLQAVGKGGKN